jgi:hypothetical protein
MLIKLPKVKKKNQPPVKDQYTDEILVPWGTIEDKLKELGLI